MKYIVVDLEMNPVAKEYKEARKICSREIIEIGAVIMGESFLVLGELAKRLRLWNLGTIFC